MKIAARPLVSLLVALTGLASSATSATAQDTLALPPLNTPATGLEIPGKLAFRRPAPRHDASHAATLLTRAQPAPGQSNNQTRLTE
jgi:hypothetical protein